MQNINPEHCYRQAESRNPLAEALTGLCVLTKHAPSEDMDGIIGKFLAEYPEINANGETIFRAGFLGGCSFGIDQASPVAARWESPDVDVAWANHLKGKVSK